MRKINLVFIMMFLAQMILAQPAELTRAQELFDEGEFFDAMKTIDKVVLHEKTKSSAQAWKLRGDIYASILTSDNVSARLGRAVVYNNIAESYENVVLFDARKTFTKEVKNNAKIYGNNALNEGIQDFNSTEYENAKLKFSLAINLSNIAGVPDTLAIYNLGLASEITKDYPLAIRCYRKCIDLNYDSENVYYFLANAYQSTGDLTKNESTLLEGLKKHPNEPNLLIGLLNLKLTNGDFGGALPYVNKLIELDPKSAVYHCIKGSLLENTKNREGAMSAYKKSIELDPNYFDPHYNLGALYFNQGAELHSQASAMDIGQTIAADKLLKEAEPLFLKAKGYLERAHAIVPNDVTTLQSLKSCYGMLEDMEGYARAYEKLKILLN